MDLNKINLTESAEEGADLILEHPVTGEPLKGDDKKPITISLMGMDSSAFRNKQRDIQNKRMAKMIKGKSQPMISDPESCEILAACTKGWSSNLVLNGEPLKFSTKAAYNLYMDYLWIREQVDSFIADRANFYKG